MRALTIGLLGCGTVGSGLVRLVERDRVRIAERYGFDLRISKILVRDGSRPRPGIDRDLLTTSAVDVIDDGCDVVVELIGGVHSAGALVRRAMSRGKDVVTANKALLAAKGEELFDDARRRNLLLRFEASVCAGIPVVRALQSGLAGDTIESVSGVVNGTCNFVLTRMERGMSFDAAVAEARRAGFAEEDPSLDIDGVDAAQKIAILAQLAFGERVRRASVKGIRDVRIDDVRREAARGRVIRLVAEAVRIPGGAETTVEPRSIPRDHPFARAIDEANVVMIRGRATGELLLSGKGAGGLPTAAAVLSDVLEIARLRSSARANDRATLKAI